MGALERQRRRLALLTRGVALDADTGVHQMWAAGATSGELAGFAGTLAARSRLSRAANPGAVDVQEDLGAAALRLARALYALADWRGPDAAFQALPEGDAFRLGALARDVVDAAEVALQAACAVLDGAV